MPIIYSKMKIQLLIAFVIIIILIFAAAAYRYNKKMMNGYWEAPDRFCTSSGIQSAQMYITDDTAYLYITTPTETICNGVINISITPTPYGWKFHIKDGCETPFPKSLSMKFIPESGMIGLYEGQTLYLELYKDSKATAGVA